MSLKDSFFAMKQAVAVDEKTAAQPTASAAAGRRLVRDQGTAAQAERLDAQTPRRLAKRSDPNFAKLTVYVREKTRKAAFRKWEDTHGGDFSELVEKLLKDYLRG